MVAGLRTVFVGRPAVNFVINGFYHVTLDILPALHAAPARAVKISYILLGGCFTIGKDLVYCPLHYTYYLYMIHANGRGHRQTKSKFKILNIFSNFEVFIFTQVYLGIKTFTVYSLKLFGGC